MTLRNMADEYLINIRCMEKRLSEYYVKILDEKGFEKTRKLKLKIIELENVIFENYKDYYKMLNYYEDDVNEFKRKCS